MAHARQAACTALSSMHSTEAISTSECTPQERVQPPSTARPGTPLPPQRAPRPHYLAPPSPPTTHPGPAQQSSISFGAVRLMHPKHMHRCTAAPQVLRAKHA